MLLENANLLLCRALCAIGNLEPAALNSHMRDIFSFLKISNSFSEAKVSIDIHRVYFPQLIRRAVLLVIIIVVVGIIFSLFYALRYFKVRLVVKNRTKCETRLAQSF